MDKSRGGFPDLECNTTEWRVTRVSAAELRSPRAIERVRPSRRSARDLASFVMQSLVIPLTKSVTRSHRIYKLHTLAQRAVFYSTFTKMPHFPQRKIGNDNVSEMGLGCMGMSQAYTSFGGYDDKESLATLTASADMGMTFVRTMLRATGRMLLN